MKYYFLNTLEIYLLYTEYFKSNKRKFNYAFKLYEHKKSKENYFSIVPRFDFNNY